MNITTWFYLGQTGLFAAATFSIAIIHIVGQRDERPPWYYFILVWSVAVACSFLFAEPYVSPKAEFLPQAAYGLRFLFGLERLGVFFYYQFHFGQKLAPHTIRRVNFYVGAAAVLVMILFWGYGLTKQVSIAQMQTKQLQRQMSLSGMVAQRKADSLLIAELKRSADSARVALRRSQLQIATLNKQLFKLQDQFDNLFVLLRSVSVNVRRVDQRVERSRRQLPTPNPIPTEAPDPRDYILRFKPVAPKLN